MPAEQTSLVGALVKKLASVGIGWLIGQRNLSRTRDVDLRPPAMSQTLGQCGLAFANGKTPYLV